MSYCVKWKANRNKTDISTYIKCSKKKNGNTEWQRQFKWMFFPSWRLGLLTCSQKFISNTFLKQYWTEKKGLEKAVSSNARATCSYRNIQMSAGTINESGPQKHKGTWNWDGEREPYDQ